MGEKPQFLEGKGEEPANAKKPASEKPPSYVIDSGWVAGGMSVGAKEVGEPAENPREGAVRRKIKLMDEVMDALLDESPEREARVLELRSKEFSRVETSLLETIVMSSTDDEWHSNPIYWKALVEELKSRIRK